MVRRGECKKQIPRRAFGPTRNGNFRGSFYAALKRRSSTALHTARTVSGLNGQLLLSGDSRKGAGVFADGFGFWAEVDELALAAGRDEIGIGEDF